MKHLLKTGLMISVAAFLLVIWVVAADKSTVVKVGIISQLEGKAKSYGVDGLKRKLKAKDPVYKGDMIRTGRGSKVQIKFLEGTTITLGAKGKITIDEFIFKAGDPKSKCESTITNGVFKIVGGAMSKISPKDDLLKVKTPSVTIGIRGTEGIGQVSRGKTRTIYTEGTALSTSNSNGPTIILDGEPGIGNDTFSGKAPGPRQKFPISAINRIQNNIVVNVTRSIGRSVTGAGVRGNINIPHCK